MSKCILCQQFAKSVVIVKHIRNEARLTGINKGPVNVGNLADGVTSIRLASVEKHRAPFQGGYWTTDFVNTKSVIQLSPRKDGRCGFDVSNCYRKN